jgi:DnaJ-class molecular chaperone
VGALIVIAAACAAGYYVSLRIWPETSCKRCGGSGRNAGSTARRFGRCKRCAGSGSKPRLGTRILTRR